MNIKLKIEMKNQGATLLTLDEQSVLKKEKNFEKWLLKKIEKKFGKKVVIDKRISESAKQI